MPITIGPNGQLINTDDQLFNSVMDTSVPKNPSILAPAVAKLGAPAQVDQAQAVALPPPIPDEQSRAVAMQDQMIRQFKQADQAARQAEEEDMAAQRTGVSQLERTLNDYKQLGPAINFQPLAAVVDSIYGGNLSKNLGPQETPEERQQRIFDLEAKLQIHQQDRHHE